LLPERLRGLSSRVSNRLGGIRGHVDGVIGRELVGWAQPLREGHGTLRVGLFIQGARILEVPANIHRADLEAAGIGSGHFGFAIPLSSEVHHLAATNGGEVELRVLSGTRQIPLGRCELSGGVASSGSSLRGQTPLQKHLFADARLLSGLLARPPLADITPRPCSAVQAKLFDRTDYIHSESELPELMFGYGEYIRYRDRLDIHFDFQRDPGEAAHFLEHYLRHYGAMRGELRVPLPKRTLDWLNETVVIPGQRRVLTRAAWAFLVNTPPILHSMNFNAPDWYNWAVYWWAVKKVQECHFEDCLVPDFMADTLREVAPAWQDCVYGPSEFMIRIHGETPELSTLILQTEAGRRDLTCALMLMALKRPDYLRFIPKAAIDAALSPAPMHDGSGVLRYFASGERPTVLAKFCESLGQPQAELTRMSYRDALRLQGFDLDTLRFLTFTSEGHRAEFAQLPALPRQAPVDVQIIGPFAKASGLGQATRLSANALDSAGLRPNRVDFGLDNPAPEGFSRACAVSEYRPAKVNIWHLNAEAIPLAAAYQPDAFSGAYNIGYFYWELDSPGACHFLGMDMLDEIWVSTAFGASIYRPHTDKPVVNVGMCYEELPEISRKEARAFLEQAAKIKGNPFVFLVTFDSFSFVQRKNPIGVLAAFTKAFPKDEDVRLIIKTQNRSRVMDPTQLEIWAAVDQALAADPRIKLIDETLQYEDILKLKKGADGYISLHKSEGWGFGMIEAMNLGVPVLCTGYSGNMDFCDEETCWLVDYDLKELAPQDYIFVRKGQKWAEPDIRHAAKQMRAMKADPALTRARAEAARQRVQREFSEAAIARRYGARIREILTALEDQKKATA
jgi:glycosyltransferase involved in cell wall biosynthesis